MKRSKLLSLILVIAMTATVFAGCGGGDTGGEEQSADTGNNLIIARSTDALTLDPGYAYSEGEIDLMYHMFDGLVKFKNADLEVEPALAETWDTSEDGTEWVFHLRQGVKFHDGTDFNADAVVFSFSRLIDENHPFYGMGDYSYFDYLLGDAIKSVETVDDYTVKFTLNDKFAPFLTYMGYYSEFIVSPTAVEKYGQEFFKNPVGTGPFKFSEWKKDEYVSMTANKDYWGDVPQIDTLIWKVVPDDSTRLMELETGTVQAVKSIPPNQLEKVKSNDALIFEQVAGANIFYLAFNVTKEPFNNPLLRKAVSYAIDVPSLVASSYEGLATAAINPMPPTVFGWNNSIEGYTYNPEKAKQLLAEAGYPNGITVDLNTFTGARPYISRPLDAAEIIKANCAECGITVNIVTLEWGDHKTTLDNLEHDMGFIGWYDIPYPANFLSTMLLDGSNTGWAPQTVVDLTQKALSTYDRDEQSAYYKEVQQLVFEDTPLLPIAHSDYTIAYSKDIEGLELTVTGDINAKNVKFK